MSNTHPNQSDAHWTEVDGTKLTDHSLKELLFQSDGLALDRQFCVEVGLYSPAGPAADTASPATLRIREIPDASTELATTTSTATLSQPLIATKDVGHPGEQFLDPASETTALSVTTVTADPADVQPPTGDSFTNQFDGTVAGSVGAAANYIPTRYEHDVYVQLLIYPDSNAGNHRRFTSFDSDGAENHEHNSSPTFAVGISILVGSSSTETEAVSQKTQQAVAMDVAKQYFTPPNSTATFTYAWRHSTPPAEFIDTPRIRPDATRYRWLSQHLGLAPINRIVPSSVKRGGVSLGGHDRSSLVREFLGTPAKVRVREAGLSWLFGGEPMTQPGSQTDG